MMSWPVLTGERRIHKVSCFAHLDYHTTWCRIILLFLFLSHCFFDLIKNSCYCSIDVALLCHLYIYILTNSLFILADCLPLPLYKQTAYHCCLPEKSTRENKLLSENYNYLSRSFQCLKRPYFAFLTARKRAQKSEQRKLREVLCLQGLRHASRARRIEEKKYD